MRKKIDKPSTATIEQVAQGDWHSIPLEFSIEDLPDDNQTKQHPFLNALLTDFADTISYSRVATYFARQIIFSVIGYPNDTFIDKNEENKKVWYQSTLQQQREIERLWAIHKGTLLENFAKTWRETVQLNKLGPRMQAQSCFSII